MYFANIEVGKETIGDRTKKMIQAHGLTQKDAAAGIGKTPQMMSHFLGQSDPPPDFVRELCAYLGEPLYKAILSKDDLEAISGVDPALSPIIDELNRIRAEKSKTEQMIAFRMVLAALKAM